MIGFTHKLIGNNVTILLNKIEQAPKLGDNSNDYNIAKSIIIDGNYYAVYNNINDNFVYMNNFNDWYELSNLSFLLLDKDKEFTLKKEFSI